MVPGSNAVYAATEGRSGQPVFSGMLNAVRCGEVDGRWGTREIWMSW